MSAKRAKPTGQPAFTASNIHYEIGDRDRGLAHGGIGAFHLLARRIGLIEAIDVVGKIDGIAFVYFNERDVVRHNLVQQIIKAYDEFAAVLTRSGPVANEPGNKPNPANSDVKR